MLNRDWVYNQASKLSHDIHAISHSFIMFNNLFKLITKIRLYNNSFKFINEIALNAGFDMPYLCFISFLYLDLYVLVDDTWIS